MKNIVIIGGGTGTFTLLAGLRTFPSNNSVIVSSADDGGSTGILRRELGVMPPGDIRQCLVGLSYTDPHMRDLFSYRFTDGILRGHAIGNIIIAGLEKMTGGIEDAIAIAGKMLNIRGMVIPVTLIPTKLSATLRDGTTITGEHEIDEPQSTRTKKNPIASLRILPDHPANPRALDAIKNADAIIFGPGDLFTSVLPNILIRGIREAIRKSPAKKILITNIVTKRGQTDDFHASDFVRVMEDYLSAPKGKQVLDIVLVNTKKPDSRALLQYKKQGSQFVEPNAESLRKKNVRVVTKDLLSRSIAVKTPGDLLARSLLRHDGAKTARAIWELLS